jgi:hypothetical protein
MGVGVVLAVRVIVLALEPTVLPLDAVSDAITNMLDWRMLVLA